MKKKYEVPVIYQGQCTFIVEAETPEQASNLAVAKFKNGDEPDELGNEWEEVDRVGTIEEVGDEGCNDREWGEYDTPQDKCPKCESDNISNEDGPDDLNRLPVTCFNCGYQWHEPNIEE
jgi:hypothetical protein